MKKIITLAIAMALLVTIMGVTPVMAKSVIHVIEGESIQEAVDSANPGDTVFVHTGTYAQRVIISKSNIILKAEDGVTLNFPADVPVIYGNVPLLQGIVVLPKSKNVIIEGFNITNFFIGINLLQKTHGIVVQNNIISSCNRGIGNGGHNNQILGNIIKDSSYLLNPEHEGIALYVNSANSHIEDNVISNIYGSAGRGINVRGDNNYVEGNDIWNTISGIILNSSSNQVVDNVLNSVHVGIDISPDTSKNLVKDNEISGGYTGVSIHVATDSDIVGNKINNNEGAGITIGEGSNILVQDNEISANGLGGIWIESADNRIIGNRINSNGMWGIALHWGVTTDNLIQNNEVTKNEENGIEVRFGAWNNTISDNRILDNGESGIFIEYSNNRIIGNEVKLNGSSGIALYYYFTTGNFVLGNEISENGWRGIDVNYGAKDNIIRLNTALDNDELDLFDGSYPPGPLLNTWEDNKYETSNWD